MSHEEEKFVDALPEQSPTVAITPSLLNSQLSASGVVVEPYHPSLDISIDDDDDGEEHHALAASNNNNNNTTDAPKRPSGVPDSFPVHIHTNSDDGDHPTSSTRKPQHQKMNSMMGLSDAAVELSPTLHRFRVRSEDDSHEAHDPDAHDSEDRDLEMPDKRSSTIMVQYDAGGHGGDEELEHVMPSLDKLAPLRKILNHFAWNLAIFLIIAGDIVLIVFKVAFHSDSEALRVITDVLLVFFLVEIAARILAFNKEFFKNLRFVIYSLTTIAAFLFVMNAFAIASLQTREIVTIVLQCASAALRFFAFFYELAPAARAMVSTNKARYQKHGFDLDLTYITDRLIAMGLPSTNVEALYRNPIDEVARFFNTMHKDHFLIINLCSERTYPSEPFHGRVVRYPFDDHNPTCVSTMLQFCVYVDNFLKQHKDNVVAVHCKGGKGRTGSMCCSFLLYTKPEMYAEQALKMFATYRTAQEIGGKLQGVSGPSQKRYIGYFENLRFITRNKENILAESFSYLRNSPPMELVSLTLNHVAPIDVSNKLRGNEKARDVHNTTWNKSSNWSLLITYYPPINTFDADEEKNGGKKRRKRKSGNHPSSTESNQSSPDQKKDSSQQQSTASSAAGGASSSPPASAPANNGNGVHAVATEAANARSQDTQIQMEDEDFFVDGEDEDGEWSAESINRLNLDRLNDTKEFYFPAREKELTEDDDSIMFDISSFHSEAKSLILTGDLKFQVFRGNLDLAANRADSLNVGNEQKPFVYCWFWINTSFVNPSSTRMILRKEQIDEVNRDEKVDTEMNLHLDYHSPPRAQSWAHAPHPSFHSIPSKLPLSPKTPKTVPTEEDD